MNTCFCCVFFVYLCMKNSDLLKLIVDLKKEIQDLKNRLEKYENPKNSRNSSIPPSKDENRPKSNQSLRKPSGLKVGGQKGRQGKTLEITSHPDQVIKLVPEYCTSCGNDLLHFHSQKEQSRQIVDIPAIKAIVKEYQVFSKTCACGCQTTSDFPSGVNTPVSYGENIEGLIAYFHARQFFTFCKNARGF